MMQSQNRSMVSYSFQDGSTLEITVKGDVETEKALRMAMALINLKFDEIGVQPHQTLRVAS